MKNKTIVFLLLILSYEATATSNKEHQVSPYGTVSKDSCKNLEDVQDVFRKGFINDAKKLKTETNKLLLQAHKIQKEDIQTTCQELVKKTEYSESSLDLALGTIGHSYAEYIKKEMSESIKGGMSPFESRSLGIAMSLCYCLERSLEK